MGVAHGVTSQRKKKPRKKAEKQARARVLSSCQPKGTHCHLNINRELGYVKRVAATHDMRNKCRRKKEKNRHKLLTKS